MYTCKAANTIAVCEDNIQADCFVEDAAISVADIFFVNFFQKKFINETNQVTLLQNSKRL